MKKGDASLNVLALQDKLSLLGNKSQDPKGIYSDSTANAVATFQKANSLYPNGVADLTTLKKLVEKYTEYVLSDKLDSVLNKGIEILK